MSRLRGYPDKYSTPTIPFSPQSPLYSSASTLKIPNTSPLNSTASLYVPPYLSKYDNRLKYKSPNSSINTSVTASPLIQSETMDTTSSHKDLSFTNKMVMDLKVEIKRKDHHIMDLEGLLEEMTVTLDQFKAKIDDLETENSKTRGNKWEKELVKRNEELRRMEDLMKQTEINCKIVLETETASLKKVIAEKSRKISELELQLIRKEDKFDTTRSFRSERPGKIAYNSNQNLYPRNFQVDLRAEEHKLIDTQMNELEKMQEILINENLDLKKEIESLKKLCDGGSLLYYSSDIKKIKLDINQMLKVLNKIREGRQISLKLMLQSEDLEKSFKSTTAQQIAQDLTSIKQDLTQIRNLIADIHAEACEGNFCITQ